MRIPSQNRLYFKFGVVFGVWGKSFSGEIKTLVNQPIRIRIILKEKLWPIFQRVVKIFGQNRGYLKFGVVFGVWGNSFWGKIKTLVNQSI